MTIVHHRIAVNLCVNLITGPSYPLSLRTYGHTLVTALLYFSLHFSHPYLFHWFARTESVVLLALQITRNLLAVARA